MNQCWILGVHFTAYGCICVIVPVFVVIKHAFDQLCNHSVDTTSETSLVCLIRPLQGIQRTYTPSTYKETQTHKKTVTYSLVETHTQKHAQLNLNVYDVISFLLCHGSMISGCSNVNCHWAFLLLLLFVVSDKFGFLSYVNNAVNTRSVQSECSLESFSSISS